MHSKKITDLSLCSKNVEEILAPKNFPPLTPLNETLQSSAKLPDSLVAKLMAKHSNAN